MTLDSDQTTGEEILARRNALKEKFGTLYDEVLAIVTRHDPIGIAEIPDECEPEADTILPSLEQAHSDSELRRIIHAEFVQCFGAKVAGPEARYGKVAGEIWDVWQRRRGALPGH